MRKPTAPKNPGFPLHRFNTAQTKAWLRLPNMRPFMADKLAKKYKSGVGVLSATLRLFLLIQPDGKYRELPPPWVEYEMWQVANAPSPVSECACRDYYDPEVGGPWKMRDGKLGHHPHCQFRDTAALGFEIDHDNAVNRLTSELGPDWEKKIRGSGVQPQKRPDEWIRTAEEIKRS